MIDRNRFAQYKPHHFTMVPTALLGELTGRRVGRNGWAVMAALCRKVYTDGRIGRLPASDVSAMTGLTPYQVARGMTELRKKGLIVPVILKQSNGRRRPDWFSMATAGRCW